MRCSASAKEFFMRDNMKGEFPGYDFCLTGAAIPSLLGISPWESRRELFRRLTIGQERKNVTWEMRRGMEFKGTIFKTFSESSPSAVLTRNPFNNHKKFYVDAEGYHGIGGLVDAFLINRKTKNVSAGLTVRTAGLSMVGYWADYPSPIHVAQSLFYSGLCGGMPWVISVMLFRPDPMRNNEERIPFEVRNFWMKFDGTLFDHIFEKARTFWMHNVLRRIEPEDVDTTETETLLNNYIKRMTAVLRITPPFAKKR